MRTNEEIKELISDCLSSFRDISKDNENNIVMIDSAHPVYDFDKVKGKRHLKSCDGFYLHEESRLLIEFKNGYITEDESKRQEIRQKVADSLILMSELAETSVKFLKKSLCFFLVYNEGKNISSKVSLHRHLEKKAKEDVRYFGIDGYSAFFNDMRSIIHSSPFSHQFLPAKTQSRNTTKGITRTQTLRQQPKTNAEKHCFNTNIFASCTKNTTFATEMCEKAKMNILFIQLENIISRKT